MNIQVEKEDIHLIGHTKYNDNGFLSIVCDVNNSNLEKILLRNILKCFGEEYKIIQFHEIWDIVGDTRNVTSIIVKTNLPYSLYPNDYPFGDAELTISSTLV